MSRFNLTQERMFERVRVLKDLVADVSLEPSACPLLRTQLLEILLLINKLEKTAHDLRESLKD